MKIQDFEGIYKWKFLIPSIYIVSWLLMILGPIFFPFGYQIYCIVIIGYSLLKTIGLGFGSLVALIKLRLTLKQLAKQKTKTGSESQERVISSQGMLYHAIVIPSYKEDQDVLLQTLSILAKSWRAKSQFIILLAMQAHQKGSDQKAKLLISKTKSNFLHMGFTQHVVREYEAKGKASNVSWCVKHLQQIMPNNLMVDLKDVMLTIIDADSWAPAQYFDKIQIQLKKRPQIKDRCMFSVPQIYTRNHLDVPVFNRTYDQMHSLAQLSNLVAVYYCFPLSNYTISYNLAKKIQWWDTCADAIGQDFHTCQKCYWKLQEQSFVTVPIFIPFNQLSLSTGEGYCNDIKARFWQAQRHTLGVSDVAYCWNMLFKTPFRFRNFILTILVTEVFAMAAVIPWALLALSIQYKLVNNNAIHFFPMWLIDVLLNATSVVTLISYVFYQWWKRMANRKVYLQENDKWWRVFQYPILFMFALFGFSLPSFLIASFAVLCAATQYRVAQKHVDKNNLRLQDPQKIQNPQNPPTDNLIQSADYLTTEKPLNNPEQLSKKDKIQNKEKPVQIEIQSVNTQSINLSIDQEKQSQEEKDPTKI